MSSLVTFSVELFKYLVFAEGFYLMRMYWNKRVGPSVGSRSREALSGDAERRRVQNGCLQEDADEFDFTRIKTLHPGDGEAVAGEDAEAGQAMVPSETEADIGLQMALFFPDTSLIKPSQVQRSFHTVGETLRDMLRRPGDQMFGENGEPLEVSPFNQLLDLLEGTKESLDVCIYVISFPVLANALIDLYKRNVVVRLIVDGREDEAFGSQIQRLRQAGIAIHCNPMNYSVLMHHKFLIIDRKILINGSFNWTKAAIIQNYDNLLVTSQPKLVATYEAQFQKLWQQFNPMKSAIQVRRKTTYSYAD